MCATTPLHMTFVYMCTFAKRPQDVHMHSVCVIVHVCLFVSVLDMWSKLCNVVLVGHPVSILTRGMWYQ